MKFYIETIGCQQNEYDALQLAIFLKSAGMIEVDSPKNAEVIFILACSVRQTAVDRIFGRIRNWKKEKSIKPKRSFKILVTSCLTPEDQKKIKEKGAYYWNFGDVKNLEKILDIKISNRTIGQSSNSVFVPIISGCDNFCSYCIVPYLRGREKSRPISDIIEEVKRLISYFSTAQYRSEKPEIILLGQNVNSYKYGFAKLLKILNDLPGEFKIRFLTNHPKNMTDDVINAIATLPKIKKEIHLPLQSGSDKILKAMNRPYTAEEYLRLVKSLKSKVHKVKITTDIIVGFPGETEENFQKTVEVCKKVGFDLAYINKYSPRKGTAAYKLGDPIIWAEKQRRWRILNELINKI